MMFEAMMFESAVATVPELDPATAVAEAAALKVWLRLKTCDCCCTLAWAEACDCR